MHRRSRALPLFAAIGLAPFALVACGGDSDGQGDNSNGTAGQTPGTSTTETTDDPGNANGGSGSFKAGDYSASADYPVPDGTSQIKVNLTLDAAGTIEDVEVESHATSGTSSNFQALFIQNIADVVKGKLITEVEVDKVAGSSLTGTGFNAALDQIISEAGA